MATGQPLSEEVTYFCQHFEEAHQATESPSSSWVPARRCGIWELPMTVLLSCHSFSMMHCTHIWDYSHSLR